MDNTYPILLVVNKRSLQEKKECIVLFMKAMQMAVSFIKVNHDETIDIQRSITEPDPEVIQSAMEKHTF